MPMLVSRLAVGGDGAFGEVVGAAAAEDEEAPAIVDGVDCVHGELYDADGLGGGERLIRRASWQVPVPMSLLRGFTGLGSLDY